jgi:hypothetical protein
VRNAVEIAFGVLFFAGGTFSLVYASRNGEEFFGSFRDGAFVPGTRRLIETVVMPRTKLFAFLICAYEYAVAAALLTRGQYVEAGLYAGAAFAFGAAVISNRSGMIANLLMALALMWLAATT